MLRLPVIRGVIDRRILVNYRVDPTVLAKLLPPPFRPKLIGGYGIGGICLIRLQQLRPKWMPAAIGLASENAAHRIAVEWDDEHGSPREGVYIPRRDSDSRLSALAGGRIIPGTHHHATFRVNESDDHFAIDVRSDDGAMRVNLEAHVVNELPATSIFQSLDEASRFFEGGSMG